MPDAVVGACPDICHDLIHLVVYTWSFVGGSNGFTCQCGCKWKRLDDGSFTNIHGAKVYIPTEWNGRIHFSNVSATQGDN